MARWGMPSPALALEANVSDSWRVTLLKGVLTHWHRAFGQENRRIETLILFLGNEQLPDGNGCVTIRILGNLS